MRSTVKIGDKGHLVKTLQLMLKAAGYYQTYRLDGVFGKGTRASVLEFQEDTGRLSVDGIVGPNTWGALDGVLVTVPQDSIEDPWQTKLSCSDETWAGWLNLVRLVVETPCVYAPGRGAYSSASGKWIIRNKAGNFPHGSPMGCHGFVCSTWTNFVAGYLLRANDRFTPTGGMPALSMVMEGSEGLHAVPGLHGATYRGYGSSTRRVAPSVRDLTLGSLYDMRGELPTFIIAAQASMKRNWWNYHHCAVFVIDHRSKGLPMYRIAADGWRGRNGFSKTPMVYREIDQSYIYKHDSKHRLRCYSLNLENVEHLPIGKVELEK